MSRLIGVNTLVFNEELLEGKKKQWEYLKDIKELGFSFVEIRREFIRDLESEFKETKKQASALNLPLFYSVPSVLFESGKINPQLKQYFKEVVEMGASQIKLTLGQYEGFSPGIIHKLKGIMEEFPKIQLSIENDQSRDGGSPEKLSALIVTAHEKKLPLKITFDTGNFVYIQEDSEKAAHVLQDFVHYIHIKNVKRNQKGELELAHFETGVVNIPNVLSSFPEGVPAAIEYPCGSKDEAMHVLKKQKEQIEKY